MDNTADIYWCAPLHSQYYRQYIDTDRKLLKTLDNFQFVCKQNVTLIHQYCPLHNQYLQLWTALLAVLGLQTVPMIFIDVRPFTISITVSIWILTVIEKFGQFSFVSKQNVTLIYQYCRYHEQYYCQYLHLWTTFYWPC